MSNSTDALLERMKANANAMCRSYATSYQLLDIAVMDALPWALSVPTIRSKIPAQLLPFIATPKQVSVADIELLATRLLAVLEASQKD